MQPVPLLQEAALSVASAVEENGAVVVNHPPLAATGERTRQHRVLVVDDDAGMREVACAILVRADCEVMMVRDGVEALHAVLTFRPDLIVTDLHMPRMCGFELLKIMRARFPQLPVVVVSGEFSGDKLPPGLLADAFLSKDCFTTPRFASLVTELLSIGPMRPPPGSESEDHDPGNVVAGDADILAVLARLATERILAATAPGVHAGAQPSALSNSPE